MPIAYNNIEDARGQGPRDQIKLIRNICEADPEHMIGAILPVITKVPTNLEDDEFDIEDVRETLKCQYEQEIKTLSNAAVKLQLGEILDEGEVIEDQNSS